MAGLAFSGYLSCGGHPLLNYRINTNVIKTNNKIETDTLIKVAPFRAWVRKTQPHKHKNYLELIYLSAAHGNHTIDHTPYAIEAPTLFVVRKEQVHHWDIHDTPVGYVLLLREGFSQQSFDKGLKGLIARVSATNCLRLTPNDTVEKLFSLLTSEQDFAVIEGLLKALLAKVIAIAKPEKAAKGITNDLVVRFLELLSRPESLQNSVAYYADKLHTSPQNLNAVCMKTLNRQASRIIADHIISEGKRLLIYTDAHVAQISHQLNFKDPSHFIKYFKRHTGCTPQAFRKANSSHHIFKYTTPQASNSTTLPTCLPSNP